MNDGTQPLRSIAAELALLFLRELEPRVADDPELLVSTEAVLAFAAIRHADPVQWEYWRAILEKYEKSDLIEYMLRQPARSEDLEWQSKADRLIGLALDAGLELFHDPDQQGWASVRVDTHWENYPIRARAFQLFLLRIYYLNTGESPGGQAIRAAAELFEARALFDGEECPVHLRVAEHGGRLYLDLCDRDWRAVEIDDEGWRVVDRPPAKFRRTRGAQPLPEPERGGSLEELRPFFNVDHHGWILIRAFLVAALRPGFPLPILVAKGEQGAGKSTACRVISSLIDPRTSALRGVPREVRDLTAAARNSWLVCFDNLSRLPEELADAACRLATGGGFGGRQLYSDHDEAIFDATRPLVFNAIPDLGTARPDFLDRALIVEFLSIKPETRRDEARFWREFSERQPRILGALLDAAVAGLQQSPAGQARAPATAGGLRAVGERVRGSFGHAAWGGDSGLPSQLRRGTRPRPRGFPALRAAGRVSPRGLYRDSRRTSYAAGLHGERRDAPLGALAQGAQRPEQCHQANGSRPTCCGNQASIQSQR